MERLVTLTHEWLSTEPHLTTAAGMDIFSERQRLNTSMQAPPTVFMYTEPELDHSWLMSCAGFDELSLSVASEKLAEVGLRRQMAHHPMRVHNPRKATVFYLPVFEFVSDRLGAVHNCSARPDVPPALLRSHHARMAAAAAMLRKSPHWQRCFGCDHVFASSNTDAPSTRIFTRMRPLADLLVCATAGRYKARAGGGAAGGERAWEACRGLRGSPERESRLRSS